MSVEVRGNNCKLWIKEREGRDGDKWYSYSIGVSKKDMNGSYINAYQDVAFTRNAGLTSDIKNGTTFDFEGWMSVKVFKDREGKEVRRPIIMINKANFKYDRSEVQSDSFEALDEDVPFN